MREALRAAFVRVDVTPPVGLPIGGNVRADSAARGTHDPLFATAMLLEQGGARACVLSFDLLGLHLASCRSIRTAVARAAGLPEDAVIVAATHTHSGPDVVDFFKDAIDPRCLAYLDGAATRVAEAVREGTGRLEEATLWLGREEVRGLSFNRRLRRRSGGIAMNWERPDPADVLGPEGPVDPELLALAVRGRDGGLLGVVANFALHPAILVGEGWRWSRDYVYYLEKAVGLGLGQAVPVLFLNGAEGDVNHLDASAPAGAARATGFDEAERVGSALGARLLAALAGARKVARPRLDARRDCLQLPRRILPPQEVAAAEALLAASAGARPSLVDGVPDEVFAAQLVKLSRLEGRLVETDVQVLALSDGLALATLPGEAFAAFGLRIKAGSPYARTMVAGLAGDCIGYIPTGEAFLSGGYEPRTATSSQLDPSAGDLLVERILAMLSDARANGVAREE